MLAIGKTGRVMVSEQHFTMMVESTLDNGKMGSAQRVNGKEIETLSQILRNLKILERRNEHF